MQKAATKSPSKDNTNTWEFLNHCLHHLELAVYNRLALHFGKPKKELMPMPQPSGKDQSPFANFCRYYNLQEAELITLMCAIAPHLSPGFFDRIIRIFLPDGGELPEFGGYKGTNHRGTLPTGETVLFILGGTQIKQRLSYISLFQFDPLFVQEILSIDSNKTDEPYWSGRLTIEKEYIEVFTTGKVDLPRLSVYFPAQHITTGLEWDDLVLSSRVMEQIRELETWIQYNNKLLFDWGMKNKIKPGYRVLFHGPPGTGKTLTATLLGKYTGREVFRIDLSTVVSKYIGETEKNLSKLFDKAENKNWILFFDEADAIFGKRTGVRDAHDKYANQEVSYLLQRIEGHNGLTILASNFKGNMDDAFTRRFNSMIYFPMPEAKERLRLWKNSLPSNIKLSKEVNLKEIAQTHELNGSHIINIIQSVCLEALRKNNYTVNKALLDRAIKKELWKEGK